jgi:hypothetical protein
VHKVDGQGLRSRCLGTTMPPTVLVTELDDGVLILQGRPDGPRVHLSRVDALPLRLELAVVGSAERALPGDQDEAR